MITNTEQLHDHVKQTIPVLESMLQFYKMMDTQLNAYKNIMTFNPMTYWMDFFKVKD